MRYPTSVLLAPVLLMLIAGALDAQEGLYAPSVPEDAALVRTVNATQSPVTVDVGPLRFRDLAPYTGSAYRPLQPGVSVVSHAGAREVLTAEPRAFLSVVLLPDGVRIISDERHTDPARAQLVIYNLSSRPVSFEALVPGAVIVPEVPAGESRVRTVNAVSVELAAVSDEPLYAAELDLERGESYTMVVLGAGRDPAGFIVQADVASE